MNRRSFLASILAAGVAPAVIGSGILMPVRKIWTPEWMPWLGSVHTRPTRLLVYPEDLANAQRILNRYYNDFVEVHADHFSVSRLDWRIEVPK